MYYQAADSDIICCMKTDEKEEEVFRVFRSNLLALRGEMTQADVLQMFADHEWELKQSALSHYENGKRRPNFSILLRFATVYGTSTDFLLGATDEEKSIAKLQDELLAAKGGGPIHRIMNALPVNKKQQILDFAEYLLSQEPKEQPSKTAPTISPLPLTERQRNLSAVKAILDSVEQKYGVDARRDMEQAIWDELGGGDFGE